jgi:hypothetical protein
MGKRHKHLFSQIVDMDNLWEAYRKASLGKKSSLGYLLFKQNEAANLKALQFMLISGTYKQGEPRLFSVFEPKERKISALPFVDRIAQHALVNIIGPIFDKCFMPQSYACRIGKGVHKSAIYVQSELRRVLKSGGNPWVLKTDFSKYFASINLEILNIEVRRKISCKQTLALFNKFVPAHGTGIPIGSLTSQLSANIYGHIVDRWLSHTVGLSTYARYMDDIVVVGRSREALDLLQLQMGAFAKSNMRLQFSKWSVQPWQMGVNFCGYRVWPSHKLLRKSSVTGAKRKLRVLTGDSLCRFVAAWTGHAKWANSHNLLIHLGKHHAPL